jgi:CheY-like chemotaxis protein
MKKILIVEDNAFKEGRIREVVAMSGEFEFETCRSIKAAFPMLQKGGWDLILLDMSFQIKGSAGAAPKKEPLAGLEILQYMRAANISRPVIVVTGQSSFVGGPIAVKSIEELDWKLKTYFPSVYVGTVYIDLPSANWHDGLNELVQKALLG